MTERRRYLLLLALIALALAGVLAVAIPASPAHKKPTLGLDLQGGLEVVLAAVPPKGQNVDPARMQIAQNIMRNRIDKLGVSEPEVRRQGSNQIVIQLAGVHDPQQAAKLIGKTAQLEFFDLEADLTGPSRTAQGFPVAIDSLYTMLTRVQGDVTQKGASSWYLFDTKTKKVVAGPAATKDVLFAAKIAKKLDITPASTQSPAASNKKEKGPRYKVLGVPNGTVVTSCGFGEVVCPGVNEAPPQKNYWYLFKYQPKNPTDPIPEMGGADLKLSGTRADVDPNQGPIVLMQFTNHGADVFQKITAAEARRGQQYTSTFGQGQKLEQHFAIVLDREIKSFPSIDFDQYPNGIEGSNGAQITGLGGFQEAKDLALVLQTGSLPYTFRTLESTDVSATLGKDSLQQAKRAAIGGLIVVCLFLLLVYRFLGLIAVIGLGIYAAFLYAALLLLNVTLTLPGFAGLVLTIGVAADANVVVFERIKEEVRTGKSVRAAIGAGYAKGFRTILDANVVTCITALVLFAVATAGVKGFALTLLIGTVISLITAVAATRAMLGLLAGFRWFDSPSFMGAHGTQGMKFLHIDYMKRRYLWFAISGTIIAIGVISLATRGLNLGIDFKGGTQISFRTAQPQPVDTVRAQMGKFGHADAQVQGRGSASNGDFKSFQIRLKSLDRQDQAALQRDLENTVQASSFGIKNVSSSFGRQIAKDAILAIIFSLFLVVLYIAMRFDVKFAVPVILAMIHDVVVTVGVYSVWGREVTTSTVAAVLTVLGYSIYDTIIIFDRIRENIPLMRRQSFATIANISLWETIRRSLATSFITVLPIISLLLFGGDTLKDFAFALLIGIISGAYSSIFIAAPLLTIWKEREPEYARRIDVDMEAPAGEAVFVEAERAAAEEPEPELAPVTSVERTATSSNDAKRERRRQRRRSRPHGRAR